MAEYSNFLNVYDFVSLGKQVKRSEDALKERICTDAKEQYTGKIDVILKTRTPLFIPNMPEAETTAGEHKKYKFFSYDGVNPVIPGSSLRGVLRSIYETITNSCLSVVDLEERPVRRTSEVYAPALLGYDENGQLVLYKAAKATVKYANRPDVRDTEDKKFYKEGARVLFREPKKDGIQMITERVAIWKKDTKLAPNWREGFYFKGEPGVKKTGTSTNAYVFYLEHNMPEPVLKNKIFETKGPEIQELKAVLESYKENMGNVRTRGYQGYQEYAEQLDLFLKKKLTYFPVQYSIVAGYIYLSPASITKEVYYTTVQDILKEHGEHDTCKHFKKLCPACNLFGMVGSTSTSVNDDYPNAWSSLVRVQDAVLNQPMGDGVFMNKEVTLMELASPKRSSTEFYLRKPDVPSGEKVLSWTYDYYVKAVKKGAPKIVAYMPELSGRKFYWHHKMAKLPSGIEQTKRNCTVKPVRQDKEFKFSVSFEKITKEQLDQLIWICNISNLKHAQGKYGYKLGKGKPLGLGSVELCVNEVKIRRLKNADGSIGFFLKDYSEVFSKSFQDITYESAKFDADVKTSFLRMCDFDSTKGVPVTYPVAQGQSVTVMTEGYKWFMNNHYHASRGGNGKITSRKDLEFQQYMIPIEKENDVTLKVNQGNREGNAESHLITDKPKATDAVSNANNYKKNKKYK